MDTHTRHATGRLAVLGVLAAGLLATGCDLPAAPAADTSPGDPGRLPVAEEDTGFDYDRDQWPHWSYRGRGCNTREYVLHRDGTNVVRGKGCKAVRGTWVSVYDRQTVSDPSELDIDHIVPLAEVARSGARGWTEDQREDYANDPDVLVAVTASSNRTKGDQDPASWLPEHDRCGYLTRWVAIKHRYHLTADTDEAAAIASVLARCPGGEH